MTKYESQEENIKNFFDQHIIPAVMEKDLDFDKLIKYISAELSVKENKVEETIKKYAELGKIKEVHYLTVPDDKIGKSLEILKSKEQLRKKTEQEIKEEFKTLM